ncbi:MAG TPA: hypothetical protein VMT45_14620 [Thermoanaerobaculaceae bacterium]|nr:hypothetical protein [Thermoanaerobaculaceae bacterium]
MRAANRFLIPVLVIASILLVTGIVRAEDFSLHLGGATYTKWLWGTQRYDGSLYNFTTVPGEGYGDNGQGSELELWVNQKVSPKIYIYARIHSRFNQNEWTNGGGWGGSNPPAGNCWGGSCGEFDSRSNQYVKLRGVAVTFTPGYKWLDSAMAGASDWGMFDANVVGKIRYIDRDNVAGLLFRGTAGGRSFSWDFARISAFRLWMGPNWNTGQYTSQDGIYVAQFKYGGSSLWDVGGLFSYLDDIEIDGTDHIYDNGRNVRTRTRNQVGGLKVGIHPSAMFDIRAAYYRSSISSNCDLGISNEAPCSFGIGGYSSTLAGNHTGDAWKADLDINDPFGVGLSFNLQAFSYGAGYDAIVAARREDDVLITEGHDATFMFPGPTNAKFGVFNGNPTIIGYGGFDGNAQQVATINVDNDFADFDEPLAETIIGWKGFTIVPKYTVGALELAGEYTHLGYNTNWQAWGDDTKAIDNTTYPMLEGDTGVGHPYRSAYIPFQDKSTDIYLIKGKTVIDVGKGIDLFFKVKGISETDKRLNDPRFLPYEAGDCPGNGEACKNVVNYYNGTLTTATIPYFQNPPVITVNGVTGYQWKPWTSISDDDRDLSYYTYQLGFGYQLTNDFYASLGYEYYTADLKDGNTAFKAYQLHEMASGKHQKNILVAKITSALGGAQIGFEYEYAWGTFKPNFGDGFVVQYADADTAKNLGLPVGSPGWKSAWGGWNSLLNRDFSQQRIKAFLKFVF